MINQMQFNEPIDAKSALRTSSKRIVVVGSGGRLGSSLMNHLASRYQVIGLDRKQLDLTSASSIKAVLGGFDYDHLFLTAALTAVDYCETHADEAFAINAAAPGVIAAISAEKGAHVTYVSTDMVFDGMKSQPYLETDAPAPISVYGASKLEGELQVLSASAGNLVTRVSWVYGPGRPAFPEWIIDKACSEADLTLPCDKVCCPTSALDLIDWLDALVFGPTQGTASGIFHLCNSNPCTWQEWGQFCIDTARGLGFPVIAHEIGGVPVDSVSAFTARRPLDSSMCTGKFTAFTGVRTRDWRTSLHEFLANCESLGKHRPLLRQPQSLQPDIPKIFKSI